MDQLSVNLADLIDRRYNLTFESAAVFDDFVGHLKQTLQTRIAPARRCILQYRVQILISTSQVFK